MKLILLRGPSGTGKSTIAKHLIEKYNLDPNKNDVPAWVESDHFFTSVFGDGKYHFNIAKLKNAHQWAQLEAEHGMLIGLGLVIVSNTFIALWEMERYLELAEEYHYAVEIIRSPGPWTVEASAKRNQHSVPLDVLKRHISQYQPSDSEAEWTDLSIFK